MRYRVLRRHRFPLTDSAASHGPLIRSEEAEDLDAAIACAASMVSDAVRAPLDGSQDEWDHALQVMDDRGGVVGPFSDGTQVEVIPQ